MFEYFNSVSHLIIRRASKVCSTLKLLSCNKSLLTYKTNIITISNRLPILLIPWIPKETRLRGIKLQNLIIFSKFYGIIGVLSWLLFHVIWKNYVLYAEILTRKVELCFFFTRFTHEKSPQNNFSCQNFGVENNYFPLENTSI